MDMLREEVKLNHVKCSIKIREGRRKSGSKETKNKCKEWETVTGMVGINLTVSIITWNMSGPNTLIIDRLSEVLKIRHNYRWSGSNTL